MTDLTECRPAPSFSTAAQLPEEIEFKVVTRGVIALGDIDEWLKLIGAVKGEPVQRTLVSVFLDDTQGNFRANGYSCRVRARKNEDDSYSHLTVGFKTKKKGGDITENGNDRIELEGDLGRKGLGVNQLRLFSMQQLINRYSSDCIQPIINLIGSNKNSKGYDARSVGDIGLLREYGNCIADRAMQEVEFFIDKNSDGNTVIMTRCAHDDNRISTQFTIRNTPDGIVYDCQEDNSDNKRISETAKRVVFEKCQDIVHNIARVRFLARPVTIGESQEFELEWKPANTDNSEIEDGFANISGTSDPSVTAAEADLIMGLIRDQIERYIPYLARDIIATKKLGLDSKADRFFQDFQDYRNTRPDLSINDILPGKLTLFGQPFNVDPERVFKVTRKIQNVPATQKNYDLG